MLRTKFLLDLAVELDIVGKAGSWFSYDGSKLGQGRDKVKDILGDNPELMEEIKHKVLVAKGLREEAAPKKASKKKEAEAGS